MGGNSSTQSGAGDVPPPHVLIRSRISRHLSNCVGINVNNQMRGMSVAGGVLGKILLIERSGGSPAF